MIILKNGLILEKAGLVKRDVLIDGEYIASVAENIDVPKGAEVIDCKGLWVRPGAVDAHVHLREPGFTHKETVKTGTMSAAKGGVTTVFAMANLNPVPDCERNLNLELDAIKKDACVRVIPFASLTVGLLGKELSHLNVDFETVIGYSDDGKGVWDIPLLKAAMQRALDQNAVIASHAEAEQFSDVRAKEFEAVKRELAMAKHFRCKYHFCHLSTVESLNMIKRAKTAGANVSCEITPHHLALTEEDIDGTDFKMAPPLRPLSDKLAVRQAIIDGTADFVATDHAPHAEKEKAVDYANAPNGVIGLETFLPVVFTELVETKLISYQKMLDITTNNALARFGLPVRHVSIGEIADLCALDIENEFVYTKEEILSKSKNSPFIGRKLKGKNKLTVFNGKIVYNDIAKN